jgi:hypothetical protein
MAAMTSFFAERTLTAGNDEEERKEGGGSEIGASFRHTTSVQTAKWGKRLEERLTERMSGSPLGGEQQNSLRWWLYCHHLTNLRPTIRKFVNSRPYLSKLPSSVIVGLIEIKSNCPFC